MAVAEYTSSGRLVGWHSHSLARVRFSPPVGCGSCSSAGSCGSRLFTASAEPELAVHLESVAPGQHLQVSLSGGRLLELVCAVYLLIPVGLLAGAAAASLLWAGSDIAALGGMLLGGWLGYALLKLYDAHRAVAGVFAGLKIVPVDAG